MTDRFNYLEIGDSQPLPPETPGDDLLEETPSWKPFRLKAVEVIGEQGAGAGQFSSPVGIAVDLWGSLYVADSNNHRVQRITSNGDVYVYGRAGQGPGQMWGPVSVAVEPNGQFFYVAEQGNQRLQKFLLTSQHSGVVDGFRSPSGVAFDAAGKLWIADTGNARVLQLDIHTQKFTKSMERSSGIQKPIALTVDTAGNLFVTEGANADVIRFSASGTRVYGLADNRRLAGPRQCAIDNIGRIYLVESEANRLHIFTPSGDSLITFDKPSSKLGPLNSPSGVALGPNGEIYISDTGNHRVLRLAWE